MPRQAGRVPRAARFPRAAPLSARLLGQECVCVRAPTAKTAASSFQPETCLQTARSQLLACPVKR